MDGTRALYLSKHGLAENPAGLHVVYEYAGRTLLGEVVSAEYREFGGSGVYLTVKHFDGSPWPLQPSARCVRALVRYVPRG